MKMENFNRWIKKYGFWGSIIAFPFLILPITYLWFVGIGSIPPGSVDADSWLTFWGGFLAFY